MLMTSQATQACSSFATQCHLNTENLWETFGTFTDYSLQHHNIILKGEVEIRASQHKVGYGFHAVKHVYIRFSMHRGTQSILYNLPHSPIVTRSFYIFQESDTMYKMSGFGHVILCYYILGMAISKNRLMEHFLITV